MKTRYNILALASLLCLGLVSCSDDDADLSGSASEIDITATVGSGTRTTPQAADDRACMFQTSDRLHVEAGGQKADYVYDGYGWTVAEGSARMTWAADKYEFTAVYPASAASTEPFVLPADQSTAEAIASADYMTYSGTHYKTDGTVSLEMERQTARIIVIPVLSNEFDNQDVSIDGVKVYADNTIGDVENITAFTPLKSGGSYTALVAPTLSKGIKNIEVALRQPDGTIRRFYLSDYTFTSGKSYSFKLKLGKNGIILESADINEWADGEDGYLSSDDENAITLYKDVNTIFANKPGYISHEIIMDVIDERKNLDVEGNINGTDLRNIRESAGCPYHEGDPVKYRDIETLYLFAEIKTCGEPYMESSDGTLYYPEDDVLGDHMFEGSILKEFTIPSVTMIGKCAFKDSENLSIIQYKNATKLKEIGDEAFSCTALKQIEIHVNVKKIGKAFTDMKGIPEIVIMRAPSTATIDNMAFEGTTADLLVINDSWLESDNAPVKNDDGTWTWCGGIFKDVQKLSEYIQQ